MPTATPFNNLITFSRGSNATLTGSNGLIQYAPNNLVTHSEQFDNAAWVKINATVTANTAASPEQSVTADTVTASAGAGYHYVAQRPTIVVGLTYTVSMYVRAGTTRYIGFGDAGDTVWHSAYLDTTNGAILNQTNCTASATEVGSGWFRVVSTFTRTSAGYVDAYVGGSNATNNTAPNFTAAGTETCIAWGAQLELGSTATTYNSTTVKNLLGFSEAFDNPAWTKSNASIVTGAQANPVNGLFNAQKLMEDTSTGQHRVFNTTGVTYAASTPVCFSAYVKAAERSFVYFRLNNSGADFVTGFVNLTTGAVTTVTGAGSITATSIGSGWWRIAAIGTSAAATPVSGYIATATSGSVVSYTGDGNSGVYIYGAQLSDSASLDPYVPTPGAAPSSTAFYGPRFDFDPVTRAPRGLLVEEQRTNLLLNSVFGGAVSGTPGTAPTSWGSFTNGSIVVASLGRNFAANSIRVTTTSARHFYSQTVALAATGTWIITFKVNVGTAVRIDELLAFNTRPAGSTIQYFYNDAAQVASFVPPTGNGILQVAVTTTGTSGNAEIRFGCGASNAVTADVTFWDAQWELGAFATSYIPTIASTVTRSADVATISGQNFAQWYGPTAGTIFAEAVPYIVTGNGGIVSANGGSGANRIDIRRDGFALVDAGGVSQASLSVAGMAAMVPNRLALAYQTNDFALVRGGGAVSADTSGTVPTVNLLQLGGLDSSTAINLNGWLRNIRFIPARAADFQLQGLST